MHPFFRACVGIVIGIAMSSVLLPVSAHAGSRFDVQMRDQIRKPGQFTVVKGHLFVDKGWVWLSTSDSAGFLSYESATKTFTIVDHRKKSFKRMSVAQMDAFILDIQMMIAEHLQPVGARVPGEITRAQTAQILKEFGPRFTVSSGGETREVNGARCTMFAVQLAGRDVEAICVAEETALDIDTADTIVLREFLDLAWRFMGHHPLPGLLGHPLPKLGPERPAGFPIEIVELKQPHAARWIVLAVSHGEFTPARVPSQYNQTR